MLWSDVWVWKAVNQREGKGPHHTDVGKLRDANLQCGQSAWSIEAGILPLLAVQKPVPCSKMGNEDTENRVA